MDQDISNRYCRTLDIEVPRFEDVVGRREANNFGLLVTALLERGGPMTLEQVARRFEDAGVASFQRALASLRRSRPATRPIHRDGDLYELDPHDEEARLWTIRLELWHQPKEAPAPVPVFVEAAPGPGVALTLDELECAFGNNASISSWSVQRLALAILDAHGKAMEPGRVVAYLCAQTKHHNLRADTTNFERSNSAVRLDPDGCWAIVPGHGALRSAREAIRARAERARAHAAQRPSPAEIAASREAYETARDATFAWLASASHAVLHSFPPEGPAAVLLAELGAEDTELFTASRFAELRERLLAFDIIASVDVRPVLRRLGFDPGERRLFELGPSQKTRKFSKHGRAIELNTTMMIRSSCGIERPLTPEATLSKHLQAGDFTRLRRALDADMVSLRGLHEYGRLHGAARLRWRQHEVMLPLGWSMEFESALGVLCSQALELDQDLDVVLEPVTDWRQPWARGQRVFVEQGPSRRSTVLVAESGHELDKHDVLLARFASETSGLATPPTPQLTLTADEPGLGLVGSFVGEWRITSMQTWNADYYDMDGPARVRIEPVRGEPGTATGQLRFGLIQGEMDCRYQLNEGKARLCFSWAGDDEGDPMSGRGWLEVAKGKMSGQIFLHLGDDSTFSARRLEPRR